MSCVEKEDRIPSVSAIVAPPMGDFGQGRVGVRALTQPASDALRLLLDLFVPELPAVLDLWQQLPNPFDVALGPDMNRNAAGRERIRRWYFCCGDVATERGYI
jgi:hypothetical protein